MYKNCDPKRYVRTFWTGLAVVAVTFSLILASSRCGPEDVTQPTVELREQAEAMEQRERIEEFSPLLEEDESQGELEITKLNPDPQVKEGW